MAGAGKMSTFRKRLFNSPYLKFSSALSRRECSSRWTLMSQWRNSSRIEFSSQSTSHFICINGTENRIVPLFQSVERLKSQQNWFHRSQHQLAQRKDGDEFIPPSSASTSPPQSPLSSAPPPSDKPQDQPQIPPTPPGPPTKKVKNFVFVKFLSFVQRYQDMMEKRFPQAMLVYRVFVVGFKDFSKELAEYVKITTKALLNGLLNLNRQELDVLYRMPSEMLRVGPTLLMSALPGFQYIVFPIAYKFPKRLLSSHFWSLQQKSQFAIDSQKKRLLNQRPVLRHLQGAVESISDPKKHQVCQDVLLKLGSGSQPLIQEIMKMKPVFESDPFCLKAMHGPHIKSLCRLHDLHTWFFKRKRLSDHAEMLYIMDMALIREGIFNLKLDELKTACFLRGLNAANTSQEDMVEFLQQWVSVSSTIQPHSFSLLLHLPVLLAYNNPNNWALIY